MAGGSGTRFWPLSRSRRPKQFLPLGGSNESLLEATARRLRSQVPPDQIFVVVSQTLADSTRALLPWLPPANVLAEPAARNTAPCVGWAASIVARRDPAAVLAVLPADHHILEEERYQAVFVSAVQAARGGHLVTVGIKPTRPETGYGYIELGDELAPGVFVASRFVEKPDLERASRFVEEGRFLWNSGMFFFRADAVLEAIREHLPPLAEGLARMDEAAGRGDEAGGVATIFPSLPNISIDNGVMEKASRVAVLPGDYGWSDVGSWTAAWELAPKDERGNAMVGEVVPVDSERCYVRAPSDKVVAVVGLQDIVVVDTPDALLVMPRERAQDVREVVEALKRTGRIGKT